MPKRSPFKYFKTSPEIIRLAVMLYVRYPLFLHNVDEILHAGGVSFTTARDDWAVLWFLRKVTKRHGRSVEWRRLCAILGRDRTGRRAIRRRWRAPRRLRRASW